MTPAQRYHSLDNLRAIMMWLGIVLHVAVNHLVENDSPLPWRDTARSEFADLTLVFIHVFRMPVFFILSGFFVAMLVSRRGYGGMLKHRLRRIGLPFIIFWPFLFLGMGVLAMLYVHLMVKGSLGIDPAIMPVHPDRPLINTMHLWFIYYLLWFSACAALYGLVEKYVPQGFRDRLSALWLMLSSTWWGFIVLALPLAAIGASYKWGVVTASGSFIPQPDEFLHNGLFFVAGLHIYRHRQTLLERYSTCSWRYLAAGLGFFILYLFFAELFRHGQDTMPAARAWLAWIYNGTTWLWSFALIGLFVRYLPEQNRFLKYISESSYWVYLVHMLGTIGFGIMLYGMPFGAVTKMGINIVATTLACLATYQLLVRHTPVGTLLNGRRIPSRGSAQAGEGIPAA
ncbi:MAG TPA: acyltransferase family protein [Noviherbaspirillum sp.]